MTEYTKIILYNLAITQCFQSRPLEGVKLVSSDSTLHYITLHRFTGTKSCFTISGRTISGGKLANYKRD